MGTQGNGMSGARADGRRNRHRWYDPRRRRPIGAILGVTLLVLFTSCTDTKGNVKATGAVVEITALDNSFNPPVVTITPGTTVRWTNKGRLAHNIVAVTGDVAFGVTEGDFGPGKTHEFTFSKAGEYPYYCSLHGTPDSGMVGKIIVSTTPGTAGTSGSTQPPDTRVGTGGGEVRRVPEAYPTIQAAVDAAQPDDMVLIAKGTYHEAVKVKTNNIVIRGEDRNETVLDGRYDLDNGFLVSAANGVAIENMAAKNYKVNGFFWTGVQGYRGSYLTAVRNGDYGIYAFDSRYGQFDHSYGSGSPDAGFYIGQCTPCDALITDSMSEGNGLGYSGTNAGGNLVIVNSTFRNNRAGVVPNSGSYEKYPPEKQTTIIGNTIYGNFRNDLPGIDAALLVHGSGIVVAGGIDNVIERNLVFNHDMAGIVLLGFPDTDRVWDVTGNRVKDNVVMDSRVADLAMVTKDQNIGNCFEGNTFKTSSPTDIEKAAPCTGPPTADISVGVLGLVGFVSNQNRPPVDFKKMPDAPAQTTMPDATSAPWKPASPANLPTIKVDLDAVKVPSRPAGS